MKLRKFKSYKHYLRVQKETDAKKGPAPMVERAEIDKIAGYVRGVRPMSFLTQNILCHGARRGHEVDMFQTSFPNADVFGSDLFPKHPRVVRWDFGKENPDWIARFDVVYTNSLDHARYPEECVKIWLSQLAPRGLLCLSWSPFHKKSRHGDCFGASLDEYVNLFKEVGNVRDLIYCGQILRWGWYVVVVVVER